MLSIITAMADNQIIGVNNELPWKIVEDLQFFKNMTLNKKIIMGRKTFESLKKPLPHRQHIVLSRSNHDPVSPNVCYMTPEQVLSLYQTSAEEVFVIGGGEIYNVFLPHVQKMYITDIFLDVVGDAHFPQFDLADWDINSVRVGECCNEFYEFIDLSRKK